MNGEQVDPALLEEAAAGQPDDEVEVVVRLGEGPPPPGLRIISQLGPIATGRVHRDKLREVHEAEAVDSLKARRSFGPPDPPADELAAEAGDPDGEDEFEPEDLLPRHSRRDPARGAGSISAFCDWGPDIAHPDGRLPDGGTRFLAIWDQRGRRGSAPGVGENRFGYGRIHDRDAINRALASGHPYDTLGLHPGFAAPDGRGSHGMHTLSIAAGTPGEGRPGGVAPCSRLVFVNLADHVRGEGATLGNSVTLLEAVDFCLEVAAGRPLVCNFSMGRTADAHWGLSLLERAFDALLLAHDGLAFVNSTGNYHRARLHAATRLTPGARYDAGWELQPGRGGPHVLEAWYPWRDTLRFELRAPDGSLLADVPLGQRTEVRRDGRLWARVYNRYRDPNAPLNQVAVYVYGDAPAGTWLVSVIGEDVVDGQCDLWIDRTGVAGAQSRFRAEDAVATSTTGSICNGFHPIAVGAFDPHDADRGLAPFSSGGPTGDGRIVPQVVAPGVRIVGARSAPPEPAGEPALLVAKSGTSEAAPFVAGLIACMYEVAGPLPIREVRRLLLQNTEPPPPASRGEEYRWGLGYLDVDRVLAATRELAQPAPPSGGPSATPTNREPSRRQPPMTAEPSAQPRSSEAIGEREDVATSAVWTVQDNQAWIRGGPPGFARDGTRAIPRGTRVNVLETQGAYAHVATTGHADLGWTARSNLTIYFSRQPELLSAPLEPSHPISIEASWPQERRELARTYNRLGGLLAPLAARARLEVPAILAVWQVESGGGAHVAGRAIIRFENHLLWRSWGQHDPERFDAHFQFGGRPPMTDPNRCDAPFRCHRYRPAATSTDSAPQWRPVHPAHGGPDDEYAALQLAQGLAGDEPALTSISIGGPQILVANYARLGYDSAREMYEAFQASETAHLLGFADFCEHDSAHGDTLQRLRDHDWSGFARRYNGSGQVARYATRLQAAYEEASQLFRVERTPATERLEPDIDDVSPQTTPEDDGLGEAAAGRGRDPADRALTTAVLAVELGQLFGGRDPVAQGQPLDLGEGRAVEVIAAPRGHLVAPAEAGDLLVRWIPGEEEPVVAVLETSWLHDEAAAASAGIPSESILPGQYATVRHEGRARLRRLVDEEGRTPARQALMRLKPPTEAQSDEDPELLPVGDGGAVPWREEDADTSETATPEALPTRVAEAIASGVRDENQLTDVAFTIAHPDVGSRKLKPDDERDKPLIQDWLRIRDELVRPALRRHRTAEGPLAPETPSANPATAAIADRFLAEHRDALRQFPWRDDAEMRLLVEAIVHGFRQLVFDAENVTKISRQRLERLKLPVTAASGLPLIHTVFMNRHPGRVLGGKLYDSYKRTDRKGEFYDLRPLRNENPLLTDDDWDELHRISELVYQTLRYVLPRITPRPIVSERNSLGEKVAARAHCYLGVRYALGPWRYEPDPEYSKLRPNTLDCAAVLRDGHGTLDCSALVQYVYADILGRLLKYRKHCPTGVMCIYDGGDFDDLGSPTSGVIPRVGDLLLAGAEKKWHHVGIYVGGDQLIDAWYTGTVVRKRDYVPEHWARVLRFKGEGAGGP